VHIPEVAVGKLVAALVVRGDFVILGEMPSAELGPAVFLDEAFSAVRAGR
jgi:hypothetical protein